MKIKKLEIEIDGDVKKLTLEQAKELRDILLEAFPVDSKVIHEYRELYPYQWPYVTWSCGTIHPQTQGTSVTTDTLNLVAN